MEPPPELTKESECVILKLNRYCSPSYPNIVLFGEPGSGKSSLINR